MYKYLISFSYGGDGILGFANTDWDNRGRPMDRESIGEFKKAMIRETGFENIVVISFQKYE